MIISTSYYKNKYTFIKYAILAFYNCIFYFIKMPLFVFIVLQFFYFIKTGFVNFTENLVVTTISSFMMFLYVFIKSLVGIYLSWTGKYDINLESKIAINLSDQNKIYKVIEYSKYNNFFIVKIEKMKFVLLFIEIK